MKNKFLAVIAAGAAAVGASMLSAPAQAQSITTPTAQVGVEVNVPPIVYLRTVNKITINLTPADIFTPGTGVTSGDGTNGTTGGYLEQQDTLDTTNSPSFTTSFTKDIANVYAVWSNSTKDVKVLVKLANADAQGVTLSELKTRIDGGAWQDGTTTGATITPAQTALDDPAIGDLQLKVDIAAVNAGKFTGANAITISATTDP